MLCACADNASKSESAVTAGKPSSGSIAAADPQNKSDNPDSSCLAANAATPLDSSEYSDISGIRALKAVLQNDKDFYVSEKNMYMNLSQYIQSYDSFGENLPFILEKFSVVDLDDDGCPEVIISQAVGDYESYGFTILHYDNGMVCSYDMGYRSFNSLKGDGTFQFSGDEWDCGIGRIDFSGKGNFDMSKLIYRITYCESSYNANGAATVNFYVNKESATEDDFDKAESEWSSLPDAKWYDFTDSNVESVFLEY